MDITTRGEAPPRRPLILMSPDFNSVGRPASEAEYVVRANYAEAIHQAGGVALILPHHDQDINRLLSLADGVLLTGTTPGQEAAPQRRAFELALIDRTLAAGKPLLGICNGMQLIGEYLGGTFTTTLPEGPADHLPAAVPDRFAHAVTIQPGSLLATLTGQTTVSVNSLHRHALTGTGRFRVVARAGDGVIEAIEGDGGGFCLGLQWHPEYLLSEVDRAILHRFVAESAGRAVPADLQTGASVRWRLKARRLALPEVSRPPGTFVGVVRTGNLVTVSGQVPLKDKAVLRTGQLGASVSLEEGRECAQWALLNALAQLELAADGLEHVTGFVRLAGYVAATADFTQHGAVIDGASELLRDLFPGCWRHARIAIGVGSLPRGVPVEIELTALVNDVEG